MRPFESDISLISFEFIQGFPPQVGELRDGRVHPRLGGVQLRRESPQGVQGAKAPTPGVGGAQ